MISKIVMIASLLGTALASNDVSDNGQEEANEPDAANDRDVANEESFVPVSSVEENSIHVNGTRYKLYNITISGGNVTLVAATMEEYPGHMSLMHPNIWTYVLHTAAQALGTVMALKSPKVLLVFLVVAVLCWPFSGMFGQPIWRMQPFAVDWWLMCAKSIIVNICPTVPMLLCLIYRPSKQIRQYAGIWTYFILWANVAWTLCFLPLVCNAVSISNAVCGVSLCISLIIHNVALHRKKTTLFEVAGDIIYGYGTSLSWLVCYTVWNALFVIELAVGMVLQDIFFWAMMIFFYYWSDRHSGIENYFAMARPISLSVYIATSDWPGLLDFFRSADPLGLNLTSHAFFLFLAVVNVMFSFYVFYWAMCLLLDCGDADDYFRTTFKSQNYDEELEDESDEESDVHG